MSYFFYYIVFFLIFYLENFDLGDFKIAIIWKIPIILFLIIYLVSKKNRKTPIFVLLIFIYAIKNIFNASINLNILNSFIISSKFMVLPLFWAFFSFSKLNSEKIYKYLKFLSYFIIFSSIPFLLGIVKSVGSSYDLSLFGASNSFGFVGIFENDHAASISIAVAVLFLIFDIYKLQKKISKIDLFTIFFGLYLLFTTYVRTGWMMLFVALIYLFLWGKKPSDYIKFLPYLIIFILMIVFLYQNSEPFRLRITDQNVYSSAYSGPDLFWLGSGRIAFSYFALRDLFTSTTLNIFFGLGYELAIKLMSNNIGYLIFAHNGFIDALQMNGIVGFIIFIGIYISIKNYIKKYSKSGFNKLAMVFLIAYLIMIFVQGGNFFLFDVMFAAILALINKKQPYINIKEQNKDNLKELSLQQ